jgi:hypothetical protein
MTSQTVLSISHYPSAANFSLLPLVKTLGQILLQKVFLHILEIFDNQFFHGSCKRLQWNGHVAQIEETRSA